MTIKHWLAEAEARLRGASVPSAHLDAELILAHALDRDRTWLVAHADDEFSPLEGDLAEQLLVGREQRVPLAYLVGYKEFYGRNFIVTSDVLVPRPETESLIELAKKHHVTGPILDVGTGSGCLGLTLALETESNTVLLDISDPALAIARKNAEALGVKTALFTKGNLLGTIPGVFAVIAANLPYVDHAWERSPETDSEPAIALFAGDGGLALIKQLIDQAPAHLTTNGYLLLEADPEQHPAIVAYASRFEIVEINDYAILLRLR